MKKSIVHASTKRNFKPIAKCCMLFMIMIGFVHQTNAQSGTLEGGVTGTPKDIYVINDDQSEDDAAIRLQTRSGTFHNNWLMMARKQGIFQIGFWSNDQYSDSNRNEYNSIPLKLTSDGDLTVTGRGKFGNLNIGTVEEDIKRVTFSNTYLSTSEDPFLSNIANSGVTNLHGKEKITFDIGAQGTQTGGTGVLALSNTAARFYRSVGINKNPETEFDLDVLGNIQSDEIHVNKLFVNGDEILPGGNSNSLWTTVGTGNIAFDQLNTNKRVGIGTSTPRSELDVNGGITGISAKIIASGGNGALTLQTTSNAKEQGIAFQNSGNWYTWNMFRKNIGNSRADLVFAGGLKSNVRQLRENLILHPDGGATLKGALKAEGILFNVGTIENPNFQNLENFINDDVLQNAVWIKDLSTNDISYNLGKVNIGNLLIDTTTPSTSTGAPTENYAKLYDPEGITLNSGSDFTNPSIFLHGNNTEFNKPVFINPQSSSGSENYSLKVEGTVSINDQLLGGDLDHTTTKNTNFHDASYFNVNGAFGVEGAASFLGETNFLGTISAEGGGALLGTYVIGNPLSTTGTSEFGTHLIGDVNIGGNLSSAFPGSGVISDVFGGLDFANTKLKVHSEASFYGQLKVEDRSTAATILEGSIFEVDVASLNRRVDVGNSRDGALLTAHGEFFVRKDNAGTAVTPEEIDDHTNISWVLKVDTKASTPTVSIGHGNVSDKFTLYNGTANFEVVGQSDLKHNVNIGTEDENKYVLNVFSKNVTIGKEGEITEVDDDGNEIIVTDLAKIPTLDVYHRSNFHGDVIANRIAVAANPKTFDSWPDFVFETSYNLQSLAEIEAFIKINKHLPAVPSAKEVAENGLDLFKMDATLLQKVEELTLYTIAQEKQLKAQKEQLLAQEERLQKLEALLLDKK